MRNRKAQMGSTVERDGKGWGVSSSGKIEGKTGGWEEKGGKEGWCGREVEEGLGLMGLGKRRAIAKISCDGAGTGG